MLRDVGTVGHWMLQTVHVCARVDGEVEAVEVWIYGRRHVKKASLCPESVSYQKKDGCTWQWSSFFWHLVMSILLLVCSHTHPPFGMGPCPSFFWYDTDLSRIYSMVKFGMPILILVWHQLRPLIHLCPGEDYWADIYHFLHIQPSEQRILIFSSSSGTFS